MRWVNEPDSSLRVACSQICWDAGIGSWREKVCREHRIDYAVFFVGSVSGAVRCARSPTPPPQPSLAVDRRQIQILVYVAAVDPACVWADFEHNLVWN